MEMENLNTNRIGNNIIVSDKKYDFIAISFFKYESDLKDSYEYVNLIKATERLIRTHDTYRAYIAHLKENVGLNRCSVFSEIQDTGDKSSNTKIEMHHGPIFTLYDYVEINLRKRLMNNEELSTFDIAYEVLDQHKKDLVQVVMLSEMAHQAADPKKDTVEPLFVNINSSYGDLVKYLRQNKQYLSIKHLHKIKDYELQYKNNTKKSDGKFKVFEEFITKWNIYK